MGQALRCFGPALLLIGILFRTAVTTATKDGKNTFSAPPTPSLLDFEVITAAARSTTEGTDATCGPNGRVLSNGPKFHSMRNGVSGPRFQTMTKGPETRSEMPGLQIVPREVSDALFAVCKWVLVGLGGTILSYAFFPMQPHLPSKGEKKARCAAASPTTDGNHVSINLRYGGTILQSLQVPPATRVVGTRVGFNGERLLFGRGVRRSVSGTTERTAERRRHIEDSPEADRKMNPTAEASFQIFVVDQDNHTLTIDVHPNATVQSVKEAVQEKTGIPPEEQRLLFHGTDLLPDATLSSCNIQKRSTLHLRLKLRGGGTGDAVRPSPAETVAMPDAASNEVDEVEGERMSADKRAEHLLLARVAEQAERYDDAVEHMRAIVSNARSLQLFNDEKVPRFVAQATFFFFKPADTRSFWNNDIFFFADSNVCPSAAPAFGGLYRSRFVRAHLFSMLP